MALEEPEAVDLGTDPCKCQKFPSRKILLPDKKKEEPLRHLARTMFLDFLFS